MTKERGASRWTVAALLAVVIAVVVSLGVAQGWFGGERDTAESDLVATETTGATEETSTSSSAATTTTSTEAAVSTTVLPLAVGDHSLCGLHDELIANIEDHLPVESPDDLETLTSAQIEYHQDAIDVLDPPEMDGFVGMLAWYEDLAAYYEPLEWNPSPGLDVLAENPPPQPSEDAVRAVTRTLEELCGVVPTEDQPAP